MPIPFDEHRELPVLCTGVSRWADSGHLGAKGKRDAIGKQELTGRRRVCLNKTFLHLYLILYRPSRLARKAAPDHITSNWRDRRGSVIPRTDSSFR